MFIGLLKKNKLQEVIDMQMFKTFSQDKDCCSPAIIGGVFISHNLLILPLFGNYILVATHSRIHCREKSFTYQ